MQSSAAQYRAPALRHDGERARKPCARPCNRCTLRLPDRWQL